MHHVMIDLETLGNKPDAPIAAIGAVFFDPSTANLGASFYTRVDFATDVSVGAKIDPETIKWWMKQSGAARAELCGDGSLTIQNALTALSCFLARDELQIWGNGASFDCVILRAAYVRTSLKTPWQYWNDRDVRTIVEIGRAIGIDPKDELQFNGTRHNALADAVHQAAYVSHIWMRLMATNGVSL